jgi:hypothetical protein
MRPFDEIDTALDALPRPSPEELLAIAEEVLEHWITARGAQPTAEQREGFRLLALHRQGAQLQRLPRDVPRDCLSLQPAARRADIRCARAAAPHDDAARETPRSFRLWQAASRRPG